MATNDGESLTELNSKNKFDLLKVSEHFFEKDDTPSPYSCINLNSIYYDRSSFLAKFSNHNMPIFLSLNVQSLNSKINSLREFIDSLSIQRVPIIGLAVQEIWRLDHPESVIIPGFKLIFKSREKIQGGGIGFYILEEIPVKIIKELLFFKEKLFESLTVQIAYNKCKFLLCNIYRSPTLEDGQSNYNSMQEFFHNLDATLHKMSISNMNTLVFLDSNINLLKCGNNQYSNVFMTTCNSNGFIQSILKATRFNGNSFSLIDQILTNTESPNITTGILMEDISDHFLTFIVLDVTKAKVVNSNITSHNFSKVNIESFRNSLGLLRWNNVTSISDVDLAYDEFSGIFSTLFDLHFPLVKSNFNKNVHKQNEFMTAGLLISRKNKIELLKATVISPSSDNISRYKNYRNMYNTLIRKSKKLLCEQKFEENKKNPKKLRSLLKNATTGNQNKPKIEKIIRDNRTITDRGEIAVEFNDFFTKIGTNISESVMPVDRDPLSYIPLNDDIPNFDLGSTDQIHFIDVMKSFENKSSSDIDNISMKLLKCVRYEISVQCPIFFL